MLAAPAPEIMIVDDDPHVREALTDFLADEGFRVRDAENGADALEQLASKGEQPALVILDLAMPVMDGYQFLYQLQAAEAAAAVPVVILSASIDQNWLPEHIVKLRKPIESHLLVKTIRGILGTRYPI
ncbi:MAG TPA: response regulator [Polyangia bacterium]|jgi:CheY-like chemotaxis protein|nr:response regulator [Polyangia bacterium]